MKECLTKPGEPCGCGPELDVVVRGECERREGTVFSVLTLNIRHGRGHRRRPGPLRRERFEENIQRVSAFLRETPADVVGLQEADGPSFWSGSYDHVEQILRETAFEQVARGIHFALCAPRLSYGTALLSRLPMDNVESVSFRARPFDTKGCVLATIDVGDRRVDVVSLHLDPVHTVRRRQTEAVIRSLRRRRRPLVVMGDLNSTGKRTWSAATRLMAGLGLTAWPAEYREMRTWPAWRPTQRYDWILVSPEIEFVSCRLIRHEVSDHLAVRAELSLAGKPRG
jgi:endonuclease/exonuclease/phosphatase family metal-dependent hydrolase